MSELQNIARQYNGLLWQLKGVIGAVKAMGYRLPKQDVLLINRPNYSHPNEVRSRLASCLASAAANLEYAEYLMKNLSESHRESYKYTQELTKERNQGE